jgi:hypothetical protein
MLSLVTDGLSDANQGIFREAWLNSASLLGVMCDEYCLSRAVRNCTRFEVGNHVDVRKPRKELEHGT